MKFVIFISHKQSRVLTRYFTRLCTIILSTRVIFLVNLDDFFAVVCTDFHEGCGFHQICSPLGVGQTVRTGTTVFFCIVSVFRNPPERRVGEAGAFSANRYLLLFLQGLWRFHLLLRRSRLDCRRGAAT